MNNDNNQNNGYNLNSTLNDDMFNVFNQTPTTGAPTQPVATQNPVQSVQTQEAPITNVPPTPPKPTIGAQPQENLITVNNYVEPKEPFSFKKLLKKKIQEDDTKFDINAITNFTEDKKVDTEELKEEKKKKSDLIKLIILLIILAIVGYFAFTVFSNYLEPTQNIINNTHTNSTIVKEDNSKTISYECDKPFDMAFYNFLYPEYIVQMTYKGSIVYTFKDDKLSNMEENFSFLYDDLGDYKNDVINYCNKYNVVYDQYQLICKFSFNNLIIKNNINFKDLGNKEIKNKLYTFNIKYNKDTILGDVLENDKSCRIKI